MATLPNIDTTTTSWIAYWNAIDNGGVASIDPSSALTDGSIQTYTLYDNGWEGEYSAVNRNFTVRVKTDGWVVAYMDRTANHTTPGNCPTSRTIGSVIDGPYDILQGWQPSISNNVLERAINSLQSNLSQTLNYAASETGLYNYMNPSENVTVLFSGVDNVSVFGFLLNSLTVNYAVVLGYQENDYNSLYFDGTQLHNNGTSNANIAHEITASLSMQTEHEVENSAADYVGIWSTVILLWDSV